MPGHAWDVLTLQPFDRHLEGADGDLAVAKRYIDLARRKSSDVRVYVYSRWPRKEKDGSLDFEKQWLRRYTGGWDGTQETRDYFETVTHALGKAYPNRKDRIFLVPVGDVLLELDRRMKDGTVPGYTSIAQVYSDGIHFNNVGSYIVGCTFYATLYKEDPKGLTASPYKVNDPGLVRTVQDAVWKVVRAHPLSGVSGRRLAGGYHRQR